MEDNNPAISALLQLIEDYHAFNPGGVPIYPYPTALDFSKQVSRGRPCIYQLQRPQSQQRTHSDLTERSKHSEPNPELTYLLLCAAFSWTKQSLCDRVKDDVEVAVTPDGRADSLYTYPDKSNSGEGEDHELEQVFVQPATTTMSLSTLLDKLCPSSPDTQSADSTKSQHGEPVYYLQSQDSNLTSTTLSPLLRDVPETIPFADAVLGKPEAINIWIGNGASVTSTHRDPYENLYLVLKGRKTFRLWAPPEEICLHAKMVRTAHHVHDTTTSPATFRIVLDNNDPDRETENRIPWIPIDPLNPPSPSEISSKYPYYQYSHPLAVTISEGEMLYLPSGWFHHVTQECGVWDNGDVAPCIAVNYWFDMDYEGEKYVMREMLGRLVGAMRRDKG
ncbi:uncharacterized protein Z518_05364 [Rhinocladiella mackenziei CBS 650.93]|uniref:JmjC domain-containing protein n=1 Tax=Rhinocladiella mackenziei CBS 650.93 TaxID=1442369 RepID=A0A0D2IFA7_9EURO|nr:uncharacterized protein Z518_05364 [Rhinocladiella mackenziei CBS 650.93]KIX04494.1 hypothetical protein Z518_05364 [Rhinocladiella mackenziei CBS 650.93]